MFAAPHRASAKSSARETPARAEAVCDRKEQPQANPLWQTLALNSVRVQTKLAVSQPDDPHEREADRVAEQVMRMADPVVQANHAGPTIQRKCAPCGTGGAPCPACAEEEEKISSAKTWMQRQSDREASGEGESAAAQNEAAPTVEGHVNSLGSGTPLPLSVRGFFEPRFGRDFGDVRVHTGTRAAAAAKSVNALAYTVGSNIVFGDGQYSPATANGQRLVAHELTHVVQQSGAQQTVQRFATCEPPPACPARASGENARSRTSPHQVTENSTPQFGILISNFAIDQAAVKPDLHVNLTWVRLIANMGLTFDDQWEIFGFSDCQGPEARNATLRTDRANNVKTLIPVTPRARVRLVTGLPTTDCIGTNTTEADRNLNRSVLIRRVSGGSRGPAAPPPGQDRYRQADAHGRGRR